MPITRTIYQQVMFLEHTGPPRSGLNTASISQALLPSCLCTGLPGSDRTGDRFILNPEMTSMHAEDTGPTLLLYKSQGKEILYA